MKTYELYEEMKSWEKRGIYSIILVDIYHLIFHIYIDLVDQLSYLFVVIGLTVRYLVC